MDTRNQVMIGGRTFSLSNLDKILWPEEQLTKGDLIKYYVQVAPYIIPHLRNRAMVFTRYPNGIEGKSFYQKNAPDYLPDWIPTFAHFSSDSKRDIHYILIEEPAVLAWLANQGCIEMHPWLSSIEKLEYPDFLVLDLDPSEGSTYADVVTVAQVLHHILSALSLKCYLKTSGALGLHIYVPVINQYTYEEVRILAGKIAALAAAETAKISTIERSVRLRGNKIYIDYLQNARGKTLCSVYSIRPRKGATVSTPLNWDEISVVSPNDFNIHTIFSRLHQRGDLFAPVLTEKQSLANAMEKLSSLAKV
ncbi:MAG TPA: non-homologous end-joining DNA ligase [Syntrophomonadaceae bacterium]|nr:non-homologous end-joining DNA ligase [Syntrophomonadaceae bacterium]HRX21449.1 non-homologous end-joining DNA ligase [Syntrophomonadaceae bacterium]